MTRTMTRTRKRVPESSKVIQLERGGSWAGAGPGWPERVSRPNMVRSAAGSGHHFMEA